MTSARTEIGYVKTFLRRGSASVGGEVLEATTDAGGSGATPSQLRIIGESLCVRMVNKTGGAILVGHILEPSTTTDDGAVLATSLAKVVGAAQEPSAADGDDVWVAIAGKFLVLCDTAAVPRNAELDLIAPGVAHDHGSGVPGVFGISISSKGVTAGNETVRAMWAKAEQF